MALDIEKENQEATSGMTKAIYEQIRTAMEPDLEELSEDDLSAMQESWKKMAYAIATGVIQYIKVNMEIVGIETRGKVDTTIEGNTRPAVSDNHLHSVDLSGTQADVIFIQSNDGTGHVK